MRDPFVISTASWSSFGFGEGLQALTVIVPEAQPVLLESENAGWAKAALIMIHPNNLFMLQSSYGLSLLDAFHILNGSYL
jgi:hypothetical protein